MKIGELWVAEYSASQDAFHVETLQEALNSNFRMVVNKNNNDYLIFGIFRTYDEANKACDGMLGVHAESDIVDDAMVENFCKALETVCP